MVDCYGLTGVPIGKFLLLCTYFYSRRRASLAGVCGNVVHNELRPDDHMSRYRIPACYDAYLLIATVLCTLLIVFNLCTVHRKRQRVCRDSSSHTLASFYSTFQSKVTVHTVHGPRH